MYNAEWSIRGQDPRQGPCCVPKIGYNGGGRSGIILQPTPKDVGAVLASPNAV
jgi:hypothetical protein